LKSLQHIIIVSFLTLVTQIGGIIWILNFGFFKWFKKGQSRKLRLFSFSVFYLFAVLLIIPNLAKLNGRIALPVSKSGHLIPHNYLTPILNRHYVKARLKEQLLDLAKNTNAENKNLKVSYLDANFPFIDGFPLLPHLSHDDGKKVDLSFYYTKNKKEGNLKPSNMGYGQFVEPSSSEYDQTRACISNGNWQYDITKYITLGSRDDLEFDLRNTKKLINRIAQNSFTQKIFIEPHLKKRMQLSNGKIRFQGCHSVRHDDHIHLQIN